MYLALITGVFVGFLSCVGSVAEDSNDDPCDQPIIYGGLCHIHIPAYLYNKESGQCERVNFCQNFPTFISEEDCEVACEDVCNKKIAPGDCTGYAYNKTSQQCEQFTNGVCDVNGNYFATEEKCEEECKNVCNKKIAPGDCTGYAYNKNSQQCEQFTNGVCDVNGNYFATEEKCEEECENDPCDQPIYTGPCNIHSSAYLYNKESGQCEEVNGCQNVPIFISEEDCEVACEDVCYKKIAHGDCTGYAYNKTSLQCEQFNNIVCDVKGNYFATEEKCEQECENDPCDQPIIYRGLCHIHIPAYLYNKESGQCERVNFCQNFPTFISEEDCEVACENVCNKKIAPGDCTGYAYNKTSQQCEQFTNIVCDVNGNYFATEEKCEEECKSNLNK